MLILLAVLIILLYVLLLFYFAFTVIAIIRGAAPIPSLGSTVTRMMCVAEIKPGEFLIDIGSGDGRILFAAAKRGARCLGIEINPILVLYTKLRAWLTAASAVSVKRTNLWDADISEADILTVYMVPIYMQKLKLKVQAEMKPGARILAAVHPFPDWEPVVMDANIFLYRIPEKKQD